MTTDGSQAGAEAARAAPAGSDKGETEKASRIQEFFGSITEDEAPELRKHIRTLLEPDFQAQDKKWQKRHSDAERRAKEAEQALQELSDPEVVERYRQEQGSLGKAKERLQRRGMPAYMVRNARSWDDLWEAEDDWQKHRAGTPAGDDAGTTADPEDAAFLERLKRLGVPVGNSQGKQPAPPNRVTPGGGMPSPTKESYRDLIASGKPMPSPAEIDRMTAHYLR